MCAYLQRGLRHLSNCTHHVHPACGCRSDEALIPQARKQLTTRPPPIYSRNPSLVTHSGMKLRLAGKRIRICVCACNSSLPARYSVRYYARMHALLVDRPRGFSSVVAAVMAGKESFGAPAFKSAAPGARGGRLAIRNQSGAFGGHLLILPPLRITRCTHARFAPTRC